MLGPRSRDSLLTVRTTSLVLHDLHPLPFKSLQGKLNSHPHPSRLATSRPTLNPDFRSSRPTLSHRLSWHEISYSALRHSTERTIFHHPFPRLFRHRPYRPPIVFAFRLVELDCSMSCAALEPTRVIHRSHRPGPFQLFHTLLPFQACPLPEPRMAFTAYLAPDLP